MNNQDALNTALRTQDSFPYKKILWKIEELWNQYSIPSTCEGIDVRGNYTTDGISKYYPRFKRVDTFDFTESSSTVFFDDTGEYLGLKHCQYFEIKGKPIYLIDNHNEMLYPLVEMREVIGKVFDVVHIDAHPDDAEFQGKKRKNLNLENIKEYIAETRISDFFDAISEVSLQGEATKQSQKIVGDILRVTHSDDFEFFLAPENPYILSLDIDIFGPEGDFVSLKDKVRVIAQAWSRAEAVVIATSPGFIDQEFAREIIKIFVK